MDLVGGSICPVLIKVLKPDKLKLCELTARR